VTLALVAPAAANARALTNQTDMYLSTKSSQATQARFFTEHSLASASHNSKKSTHMIKKASGTVSVPTIKPDTIVTSSGATSGVTMAAPSTTVDPSVDQSIDPNAC
jgi:hypothetical protein